MKRLLSGLLVFFAVFVTAIAARKIRKPYVETAPAYRIKGPVGAPVTIAEFSDFECPACRAAEEPLQKLLALYGSNVRFMFKDFPLERIHPWANGAALAAECAGEQGHFWELHDILYQKQPKWVEASSPPDQILIYVKKLGLNEAAFKSCLTDPQTAALIQVDIQEARNRWVNATPTFFINGKRFVGSLQLSALAPLWIDKILEVKKK